VGALTPLERPDLILEDLMTSKLMPQKLFAVQLAAHLSVVPMLLYGQTFHYLLSFVVYFFTGCLGMSMTYHRLVAHRSWKAPKWFEILGLTSATLGVTGSCIGWCAVHLSHHQHSDKDRDPHSPHHMGFFRVQFLSMFVPAKLSLVRGFVKNPTYRFFHRYYWQMNLAYALLLFMIDPFALVYLYLFPACILWNAGSLINTMGHRIGSKPFQTGDESRNNLFLGIFMWGEGWHNNHHRFPKSSRFGREPWQLDISSFLINLIQKQKPKIQWD